MHSVYNRLVAKLISWPRWRKRFVLAVFDFSLLLFALWFSYVLRHGSLYAPSWPQIYLMIPAPILAVICFNLFGVYNVVVRYLTEKTFWSIFQAITASILLWLTLIFMTEWRGISLVPRSVPVIYGVIGAFLISASRILARRLLGAAVESVSQRVRVLIYGASASGRQLAAAFRADRHREVVAFIDSEPALVRTEILGLKVLSPDNLLSLIDSLDIGEVIICGDRVEPEEKTEIFRLLGTKNIRARFLPPSPKGFGDNLADSIREIEIDDLLGRPVVEPDTALLRAPVTGQSVLVTGAGGSIGSELCRQIMSLSARKLVMVDMNEFALYEVDRRLRQSDGVEAISLLGSVADRTFVEDIFKNHAIDIVFHAAAYKHVPLIESNPLIGISNNVIGTWIVAEAARNAGVERFVLISTDKAVRPTNVMGATKRWSELIVRALGSGVGRSGHKQHFCAVRFGNVIGSQGSVVPLFTEQIEKGGPITLTDEGMTRYFMSVSEATELIIQAASLSESGEVFLLDMGQPVRIRELAENMIRLSGRSIRTSENPSGDIEIVVTGTRPGEKLSEELVFDSNGLERTKHPKILRVKGVAHDLDQIRQSVDKLAAHVANADIGKARDALFQFVNEA